MRKHLRRNLQDIDILEWHEVGQDEKILRFVDLSSAQEFLGGITHDILNRIILRNFISEIDPSLNLSILDDDEYLFQIAQRLASGAVLVVIPTGKKEARIGGGADAATEIPAEEPTTETPAVVTPALPSKHWIELQIVDDQSGEPIHGIPFKLKLPSGEVVDKKMDNQGRIYIDNLDSGTFDIQEMLDDVGYEVVKI